MLLMLMLMRCGRQDACVEVKTCVESRTRAEGETRLMCAGKCDEQKSG